jgi:site-specific recombinase XerD
MMARREIAMQKHENGLSESMGFEVLQRPQIPTVTDCSAEASAEPPAEISGPPAVLSQPPAHPLRQMVEEMLDGIAIPANTKRNYRSALTDFINFLDHRVITSKSLREYVKDLVERRLATSTINVRIAAVRKLIAYAQNTNAISDEMAYEFRKSIESRPVRGTHTGNWLSEQEVEDLLDAPDLETLKGKRDYAILAVLIGCGMRRAETAAIQMSMIQTRDRRWVIADMIGKGNSKRTVPIPTWVKEGIDAWVRAACISRGSLFRRIRKGGSVSEEPLSPWGVWQIVKLAATDAKIASLSTHDLRRTAARLCLRKGGDPHQIQKLLGHQALRTTEIYLNIGMDYENAVNDLYEPRRRRRSSAGE